MAPPDKMSDADKVISANHAYYTALSARDMRAMEKIWTCASDNILIAPPVNPVTHVGWDAIKRNWERYWAIFETLSVSMEAPTVNVNGPVAWVHGTEHSKRLTKSGEVTSSSNYGTNIFVKHDGHWLMVFHQAALIPAQDDR
jgi:ketosteroid isomerase-like protein